MNGFKFKKVKGKFRWESDFMVIEFSDPSIQGFSDYINLKREEEIMYYYYTVKIFKKIIEWDDNDNEVTKWKLVSKRSTSDFPTILELKWILDYQLKDNTIINGQKIEYNSGAIKYSKVMATEGFACDDFYEITKSVNSEGKDDRYIVYCGTTFDTQGDLNSSGIRTPYVCKKDIEELFKCVTGFIQYSLDEHNKQVDKYNISFDIKDGKIYEYVVDDNIVNKNKIESIFAIGDTVGIKTVIDNKEYDYDNITISEIKNKDIELSNGDIINGQYIVYMNNNPTDEMLRYKENNIAKEFANILSEQEIEEFKNCNIDELLEKYKMAIIDRTWMCREEHEFAIDYNQGNMIGVVTPIVKNIINIIKTNL